MQIVSFMLRRAYRLFDSMFSGEGVKHPSEFESFMMGCTCGGDCSDRSSCDCQSTNEFRNGEGELQRAYDNEVRFWTVLVDRE